jgi:hypothetical protein
MHLSRNGKGGGEMSSANRGSLGMETPDRFYRPGSNLAMRAGPIKKQKTGPVDDYDRYSMSSSSEGTYDSQKGLGLTRENIAYMVQKMKYAKDSGASYGGRAFQNPLMPAQPSTPGSMYSESEEPMDADKETNLRRERNRIAARKSRQRKLDRISNLEDEKMRLEQHRDMLVQEIRSLEKKDATIGTTTTMRITDKEYSNLQEIRSEIIKKIEAAYNSGDILSTMKYFREDSIVSGPQNSSVHLRGKDALVLDYLCTSYLFSDIHLQHTKLDSGGPRSQHFRVHWVFTGKIKSAGVSMNKEFLQLIDSVKGKRVAIEGVSNFSFSGDKIVYVHRTADQAKFLSALVNLSK